MVAIGTKVDVAMDERDVPAFRLDPRLTGPKTRLFALVDKKRRLFVRSCFTPMNDIVRDTTPVLAVTPVPLVSPIGAIYSKLGLDHIRMLTAIFEREAHLRSNCPSTIPSRACLLWVERNLFAPHRPCPPWVLAVSKRGGDGDLGGSSRRPAFWDWLRPHGRHQRPDTHDAHHPRHVVGEDM
jgi:hypothetical protein